MVQVFPVSFKAMLLSSHVARHWLLTSTVAAAAAAFTLVFLQRTMRRQQPSPEQQEAQRRQHLTEYGRIVDGSLIAAAPSDSEPRAVIYQYRIGGVTYERSQDVSTLASLIGHLRPDYPVQVRYNRANPADSIVVSETWNGLFSELWHSSEAPRVKSNA